MFGLSNLSHDVTPPPRQINKRHLRQCQCYLSSLCLFTQYKCVDMQLQGTGMLASCLWSVFWPEHVQTDKGGEKKKQILWVSILPFNFIRWNLKLILDFEWKLWRPLNQLINLIVRFEHRLGSFRRQSGLKQLPLKGWTELSPQYLVPCAQ